MRIVLISDLHGNEIALEAVLRDAQRIGYDALFCLGDVATLGPRPHAVLARLRDLGCRTVLGNHDEFMLDAALIHTYSEVPMIVSSVETTRETLTHDELELIRGFERTIELDGLLLHHGTPRSNMEDLLATTAADDIDPMLEGRDALVFAGGHTHVQMVVQHRGRLLVNPGSVGMPFREYAFGGPPIVLPHAEYAIVELGTGHASVTLRRVDLERRALASQLDGWDDPLADSLRAFYS